MRGVRRWLADRCDSIGVMFDDDTGLYELPKLFYRLADWLDP